MMSAPDIDYDQCDLVLFNPIGASMTRLILRSALVICVLAVAAQASAEVVLLSQSRSVFGDALASGPLEGSFWESDTLSAPDFGLFEEEISFEVSVSHAHASCSSTQNSEIQTDHFSIHGSASASGSAAHSSTGLSSAGSDFEVRFHVSTPMPFSLIGSLASDIGDSPTFLHLQWNGETYLFFSLDDNDEITISEAGVLEPGDYTLTVSAHAAGGVLTGDGFLISSSSFVIDFFMGAAVAVEEMSWGQVKALYR